MSLIIYRSRPYRTSRNFWPILTPLPCHTLSHIPGPPKVRHTSWTPAPFLVGLVQKTRTKAPCTNSLSIVPGGFGRGFCQGVFCLEGFVRVDFIRFHSVRKLSITLNIMFHMYDNFFYKCDVTCDDKTRTRQRSQAKVKAPPYPCHKLSHRLGPLPPRA